MIATLRKRIRVQMNQLADEIAGGDCPDWATYQHMVGIMKGYALVEREILDLSEKAEDED